MRWIDTTTLSKEVTKAKMKAGDWATQETDKCPGGSSRQISRASGLDSRARTKGTPQADSSRATP
jgi:hypothetical protein